MPDDIFNNDNQPVIIPISERPQDKAWTVSYGKLIVINAPPKRKVFLNYNMVSEYEIGDVENERLSIVYAYINGVAKQKELAKLWGLHYNTVNNYIAAYKKCGFSGLTNEYYDPAAVREKKQKADNSSVKEEMEYYTFPTEQDESVSETVDITDLSNEAGIVDTQDDTNNDEADQAECIPVKGGKDTKTGEISYTKYAGRMLYYPLINEMYHSIFKKAEKIKPAEGKKRFGLKQIIVTLLFYVLCGIASPEESKLIRRKEFGVLIGEPSAPCCKTLRNGLNMLTLESFPKYIMGELPRQYVKLGYVKLGVFYIDGHFIPYYGKQNVHKGYSTQRRIAMKGHYQNWVNDVKGRPIFFYVNNSFVKFTDAIKESLKDAKKLMEEAGISERLILVFDRGAFDGKFFKELDGMGIGFITWLKGKQTILGIDDFDLMLSYKSKKGQDVSYKAKKGHITINKYRSSVEAITIFDEATQKQSTFINNLEHVGIKNRSDSDKIELLDGRWAQENFFKEAKVKANIDHQMGYQFETDGEGEDLVYLVDNPEYIEASDNLTRLNKKLKTSEKNIAKMMKKHGKLKRKKPIDEYLAQKGNRMIIENNKALKAQIEELTKAINIIPARVPYNTLKEERKDILRTKRSSVILSIRASGYNIMKAFEDISAKCFNDHRELGKFVLSLVDTSGEVIYKKDEVLVKLKKLETPAYQRAAEKVIAQINQRNPVTLDGSGKRIVFEI